MMKQLIGKEIDGERWVLGQYVDSMNNELYFPVSLKYGPDPVGLRFKDFFEIDERRMEYIRTFFLFSGNKESKCLENSYLDEQIQQFWENFRGSATYKAILSLNWTEDELTSVLDFCNNNVESITGLSIQQVINLVIDQFQLEEQK